MYNNMNEGNFHRFRRNFKAPVNVGDVLDITIEAKGEKGDGLAKKDGFVIFVPNTNVGDKVKIKINKVLRKVAFGTKMDSDDSNDNETEPNEETNDTPEDSDDF